MTYKLPDLPYDYNALEPHIDEQTMQLHHGKHHATYVEKTNKALEGHDDLASMEINELLINIDKVPADIKTTIVNNGGGHANHTLFWTIMTPDFKEPDGEIMEALENTFGGLKEFQDKFKEEALGRFGSGWAWLVVDKGEISITNTPNQDSPLMEGLTPILGIDVWEHAYYLKYQNKRAEYIDAWWNVVNWEQVSKNLQEASK